MLVFFKDKIKYQLIIFLFPLSIFQENRQFTLLLFPATQFPCINAGDPNLPHDPDGTISDLGAFYFLLELKGDINWWNYKQSGYSYWCQFYSKYGTTMEFTNVGNGYEWWFQYQCIRYNPNCGCDLRWWIKLNFNHHKISSLQGWEVWLAKWDILFFYTDQSASI